APGAYLWHHHRVDADGLRTQLEGYAVGLGSFLAKVALSPHGRSAALRRLPAAAARLRHISDRETGAGDAMPESGPLRRGSRLARGGWAYLRRSHRVRRDGGVVPPMSGPFVSSTVPAHIQRAAAADRAAAVAAIEAPEPGERVADLAPARVPAPRSGRPGRVRGLLPV
ncbi:hypothetical protein ACLFMI_26585, partial [Pseudonocardia nantongensis]|uniref:hypothetical protein n=1 Tax=Pseudonocardia nantongensis TaxID=1181885 RepID=UPI00397B54CA